MLNALWAFMILFGILFGILNGRMDAVTQAALDASKEAVTLCVTMTGILSFWMGIMQIAKEGGIVQWLTKKIQPFLDFLFPDIPKEHKAREYIAVNMISNFLGLGWAATPAGLKAMKELSELEKSRKKNRLTAVTQKDSFRFEFTASNEMCTFLVINISSLQLIPVNIIAFRSQYGSVNPAAVVLPGILATICSTIAGIFICKCYCRKKKE